MSMTTELLGWSSSAILLTTLMRQVYSQWRSGATAGLSKWLFLGQCTASVGYIVYSFMLNNWVFMSSNVAILLTAVLGETLFLRNRRMAQRDRSSVPQGSRSPAG